MEIPLSRIEKPQITNVVITANFGCTLDLLQLTKNLWNIEYDPKRKNSALLRLRKPFCVAMLYSSGKVVLTGASSEISADEAIRKVYRMVKSALKLNDCELSAIKVVNLVGKAALNFSVDLETCYSLMPGESVFDPLKFPGLRVKVKSLNMTIYANGKVSFSGGKSEQHLDLGFRTILPVLIQSRK